MTGDWRRDAVASARVARLATADGNGEPSVVPCVFALVDEMIVSVIDEKPKSGRRLQRLKNIAATGRATLLVDHYDEDWSELWFVMVRCHAEIIDAGHPGQASAIEALRAKYPQYLQMDLDSSEVIRLHPERWTGWRAS